MYLWPVRFNRSKTIEPAAQPVVNGWTTEPVNRRPHQFDLRSGPNNYADCCPIGQICITLFPPSTR